MTGIAGPPFSFHTDVSVQITLLQARRSGRSTRSARTPTDCDASRGTTNSVATNRWDRSDRHTKSLWGQISELDKRVGGPVLDPGTLGLKVLVKALRRVA